MSEMSGPVDGVALLVMTDGRDDYLNASLLSATHMLTGNIVVERWMHDDTGDDTHRTILAGRYPDFRHIGSGPRRGFGGAIQNAWRILRVASRARFILHVEQDFTFRRPVDLAAMAAVLDAQPHLAQMALVRQPWNTAEHAAGGLLEAHPGAFTERSDDAGHTWLEHRLWFSTNPSLYRRTLLALEWPYGEESEGRFGLRLLEYGIPGVPGEAVRFGYWGQLGDGPAVDHIGDVRIGVGY